MTYFVVAVRGGANQGISPPPGAQPATVGGLSAAAITVRVAPGGSAVRGSDERSAAAAHPRDGHAALAA